MANFFKQIGIKANGVMKKERMITDEINEQNVFIAVNYRTMFDSIEKGFEEVNEKYNEDWTIEVPDFLSSESESESAASSEDNTIEEETTIEEDTVADTIEEDTNTEEQNTDTIEEDAVAEETTVEEATEELTESLNELKNSLEILEDAVEEATLDIEGGEEE